MRSVFKVFIAISIACIIYVVIGYSSRWVIHGFLLPNGMLDINYYDTFSGLLIVLVGALISMRQMKRLNILQVSFSLWMILLYWVITAFPILLLWTPDTSMNTYLFYFFNNLVYNLWSGSSAFVTHQGLEILYVVLVALGTQQFAKHLFVPIINK